MIGFHWSILEDLGYPGGVKWDTAAVCAHKPKPWEFKHVATDSEFKHFAVHLPFLSSHVNSGFRNSP